MITNLLEYLEKTEKLFPNKLAVISELANFSYRELVDIAKRIGTGIVKSGLYKNPVFIFLDKESTSVATFFGVLYSGNFYVPMDVSQPDDRISRIIATEKNRIIITDHKFENRIRGIENVSDEEVLLIEDICCIDIDEIILNRIRMNHIDMDPAYVMFTSGSTGIPKGVVVSHQSVIDYIEWVVDTFGYSDSDILGNQSPFYFDNSVLDIYTSIKVGATLHIIPRICFTFAAKFQEYLNNNRISSIFCVPSVLCNIAKQGVLSKGVFPYLEKVLFCGEKMPVKYLNMWIASMPEILYGNLYGPTEITDVCTAYIVERGFKDSEILPIGRACKNSEVFVLTDDNRYAEIGEIGEICVRGRCLSLGYYGDRGRSLEVFVQNPLNKRYRDIIYRTGDKGKINEYGELICLGRTDQQIKYLGYRIEMGEIEAMASAIDKIEDCACVFDEDEYKICLFYVGEIEKDAVISLLRNRLPSYMVPSKYVIMDMIPHNPNGKIDRVALSNML